MIAHKVQCLCCLVFHIVFLVTFLFVIHVVCKMCKSFDRKKKKFINITCIEFVTFGLDLIPSTKHNFEVSQIDNTYTWSHQFEFITQHNIYFCYFCLVCSSLMIHYFVKTFT